MAKFTDEGIQPQSGPTDIGPPASQSPAPFDSGSTCASSDAGGGQYGLRRSDARPFLRAQMYIGGSLTQYPASIISNPNRFGAEMAFRSHLKRRAAGLLRRRGLTVVRLSRRFPDDVDLIVRDEFGTLLHVDLERAIAVPARGGTADSVPWMRAVERLSIGGELAIDVGACQGQTSMFLAKTFKQVLAFEPAFSNFRALTENLKLNGALNINAVHAAVADRPGSMPLNLSDSRGHHSIGPLPEGDAVGVEDVTCVTLDEHLDGDCPDLIKIDVEGFETEVLRGAQKTIALGVRFIVVEVSAGPSRRLGRDLWDPIRSLSEAGYRCEPVDGRAVGSPTNHVDVLAFRDASDWSRFRHRVRE